MARLVPITLHTAAAVLLAAAVPLTAEIGRWTPVGPEGGGPRLIAADPRSTARLYATFPWGAYGVLETLVMRSDDAGTTWQASNRGLEGERIIALAVDPLVSGRVFAVAAVQGCYSDDPGGFYRSDDAGAHWQLVATSEDVGGGLACSAGLLALSNAVLVGTAEGVARSTDGGATWQEIPVLPLPYEVHTLLRDPRDERVLYAVGWLARFKSLDGGLSWTPLDDPPALGGQQWVTAFAISASDPDTLYEYGLDRSLWRSRDGGASWGPELPAPSAYTLQGASMLVDPRDPETLFVGTDDGLWVSRDGGSSFHRLHRDLPETSFFRTAFPGVSDLALDASNRVLVATATGLASSTDAGRHWTSAAQHGVHANAIRFLRFDPFNPGRFLFTSFEALFETRDGGATAVPLSLPHPGLLQALEFDPFERGRLVALTMESHSGQTPVYRLFESRSGGHSWSPPSAAPRGASALAVPAPHTLLAAAGSRIYLRPGAGGRWRRQFEVESTDERSWFVFSRIVADPYREGTLFALGFDIVLHGGAYPVMYSSLDAGSHWSIWSGSVTLAFDPGQPDSVYTDRSADIFRRRVDGRGAQLIGGIRPADQISALLVDRSDPQTFYAATAFSGVLVSRDGATTWSMLAPGLPLAGRVPVTSLEQDPLNPQRLYTTPSSGGLWRLDLAPR